MENILAPVSAEPQLVTSMQLLRAAQELTCKVVALTEQLKAIPAPEEIAVVPALPLPELIKPVAEKTTSPASKRMCISDHLLSKYGTNNVGRGMMISIGQVLRHMGAESHCKYEGNGLRSWLPADIEAALSANHGKLRRRLNKHLKTIDHAAA